MIRKILEKIKTAITDLVTKIKHEIFEEEYTNEQKYILYHLNNQYNLTLDVIENQIEMMQISYLSKTIDEGSYRRKQDELINRLAVLKELYLQDYNAVLS